MQSFQENQMSHGQPQNLLLQQQMQNCSAYDDQCLQQQPLQQMEQLHHQYSDQCMPKVITTMTSFMSSATSQAVTSQTVSSTCTQHMPSSTIGGSDVSPIHSLLNSCQDGGSRQSNLCDCSPLISPASLPSKRVAVELQLPCDTDQSIGESRQLILSESLQSKRVAAESQFRCHTAQSIQELAAPPSRISELSTIFQRFLGREFSAYQDVGDIQNGLLFGVNMEQSELANLRDNSSGNRLLGVNMQQSELANLRDIGSENNSLSVPYACSGIPPSTDAYFAPGSDMTTTSCVDESGFLQSSENVDQANPSTRTFVKVHKSGSFGRSLDISNFNSYHELRSELPCLFGLEGQLEDPLRSGWQLVFVDRENDILLLGDDPWQEFVNNVWYIKILSPQEVRQMGREGFDLPSSGSKPTLYNSAGDDYINQQPSRINCNWFSSVASFDY